MKSKFVADLHPNNWFWSINNISCKWTPIVMLFTFVPFPNTIVFTIQRLKISGLEFGSEHSNKKKKYVAEGERLIIRYCLLFIWVGSVLQTQSCRNIRSYEWCIYIKNGKITNHLSSCLFPLFWDLYWNFIFFEYSVLR